MITLRLRDGDLVLERRDYGTVTGAEKLAQDLRGALLEPLGNDRFHPGWGSALERSVGVVANELARQEVEGEVGRVIQNYVAVQRDKIEADANSGSESRYSTHEVLAGVRGVTVKLGVESVQVGIALTTLSGETVVLNEAVA